MDIVEIVSIITQAVTALAAVVALFLVVKQMRQLDDTLRSQVYQGLIDNSLKIDELLIEKPEFRKYVYGEEIIDENTPGIDQIMSVMEFVVDVMDNVKAQESFIPKAVKPGWRQFSQDVLSSPAAQFFMQKHGLWYSGGLKEASDKKPLQVLGRVIERQLSKILKDGSKSIPLKSYISPKVEIHKSMIHGSGMFAKRKIRKGEIVFIKGGYILTGKELFSSEKIYSYLPIDDDFFIGSRNKQEEDGIKLFLNHSCEPNCGLRGEITFVAMVDIQIGQELTCDYAMIDDDDYKFTCNCGGACCRKIVTGSDWKIVEIQNRYYNYFARYLIEKINTNHQR
jgi:uncharacterized protein